MADVTLLLAATELEAAPLRAAAAGRASIAIAVVGVGEQGVPALREALRRHRPARLLAFGLAGSLAPDVRVGDTVLARRWLDVDGQAVAVSEAAWRQTTLAAVRRAGIVAHEVDSVTVPTPLHGSAHRDALRARTGAAAAQMEDGLWAAQATAIPVLAARVISDDCDLPLPLPRHLLLRADGAVRWRRWMTEVLRGPLRALPDEYRRLRRAQREWRVAMQSLARLAGVLVEAIVPPQ